MRAHHIDSPSQLERRMLCRASRSIEIGLPDTPSSEDAQEGTLIHEAIEKAIIPDNFTPEQKQITETCLLWLFKTLCGYDFEFKNKDDLKSIYDKIRENNVDIYLEPKLRLFDSDFSEINYGYADVVAIINKERLIVIDWKFGRNPVEFAGNNPQLACLGAMAMQKYGFDKCEVFVVQPRVGKWNDTFTFTNCDEIIRNIKNIIDSCKVINPSFCAGDKQCKYCKGNYYGTCPVIKEQAITLAEQAPLIERKINELSNIELVKLYDAGKVVESLMKKVSERIREVCIEQGSCENITLQKRSGKRNCSDVSCLYKALSDTITHDEFISLCSINIGSLETLFTNKVKESGEVKTLKDGKEYFKHKTSGLINTGQDTVSIKRG